MAAVLLLGVTGAGAHRNSVRVLPPPEGPWPEGGSFTVFLCMEDDPNGPCRKRAVTPEQRRSVEERLRAMPEVARVTFVPRETTLARMTKAFNEFDDDKIKIGYLLFELEEMPESFEGTLHRRADFPSFGTTMRAMPGVSTVGASGRYFWEDKADVRVVLCPAEEAEPEKTREASDPCAGRGAATAQERKNVEARLTALEGIERVHFEDAAHARRVQEYLWVSRDSLVTAFRLIGPMPEGYRVKLTDPKAEQATIDAMEGMPGVAWANLTETG